MSRTMRSSFLGSRFLLPHRFLVLLLPLLVWRTRAFLLAPLIPGMTAPSAPQVGSGGSACRPQAPSAGHRATIEDSGDTVAIRAEVWQGFEEKDHDRFLAEFWQKKPLLIRRAVKGFQNPLGKSDLGGLACCPEVECRLVAGGAAGHDAGKDWEVEHGPFTEESFLDLGETHWTLLVNEANRHVPEVSDLLDKFQFVPSWRIDDVMISYAPEGGSVGPHVDNYDVFLLQGAGTRCWSIEGRKTSDEEEKERSIPDIDLRVLSDFKEAQAWVLQPGDALYLPPRIAHHGVSLDKECMTYSVGFRAPSTRDLVTFFGDHVASTATKADSFYEDPDLQRQENHGLISRGAVSRAKKMIREALLSALDDEVEFDRWFGAHVTRSRRDHTGYPMPMDDVDGLSFGYQFPADVTSALRRAFLKEEQSGAAAGGNGGPGPFVYHAEGLTFAFVEHEGPAAGATLFVDGNPFPLPQEHAFAAGLICRSRRLSPRDLGPALEGEHGAGVESLLHSLLEGGYLYPADD